MSNLLPKLDFTPNLPPVSKIDFTVPNSSESDIKLPQSIQNTRKYRERTKPLSPEDTISIIPKAPNRPPNTFNRTYKNIKPSTTSVMPPGPPPGPPSGRQIVSTEPNIEPLKNSNQLDDKTTILKGTQQDRVILNESEDLYIGHVKDHQGKDDVITFLPENNEEIKKYNEFDPILQLLYRKIFREYVKKHEEMNNTTSNTVYREHWTKAIMHTIDILESTEVDYDIKEYVIYYFKNLYDSNVYPRRDMIEPSIIILATADLLIISKEELKQIQEMIITKINEKHKITFPSIKGGKKTKKRTYKKRRTQKRFKPLHFS